MLQNSKRIGSINDTKEKKSSRSCNCKRSSCLKLYCECFANGSYCQASKCNCTCCHNNAENNHTRKLAIESTLERNPNAFRSKIFVAEKTGGDPSTKHHKGCHCKKSNCLKKYCECFQGGVVCSEKCRCLECRNFTGSTFRQDAIQRAQLKEKHGEGGDSKLNEYSNDYESVERPKTNTGTLTLNHSHHHHPLHQHHHQHHYQQQQHHNNHNYRGVSSLINEKNVTNIVQTLIDTAKKSTQPLKRKYENIDASEPSSTVNQSTLQSQEQVKSTLIENYTLLLRDLMTQPIPSIVEEGNRLSFPSFKSSPNQFLPTHSQQSQQSHLQTQAQAFTYQPQLSSISPDDVQKIEDNFEECRSEDEEEGNSSS